VVGIRRFDGIHELLIHRFTGFTGFKSTTETLRSQRLHREEGFETYWTTPAVGRRAAAGLCSVSLWFL
jgi:hypothetical protein